MTSDLLAAARRLDLALAFLGDGDAGAAAEVARAATELAPQDPQAWFVLGEAAEKCGDSNNAVAGYRQALALDPTDRLGAGPRLAVLGVTPVPDGFPPAYVEALFDDYAPAFEKQLIERLRYDAPAQLTALIADSGLCAARALALDIGCGTGLAGLAIQGFADSIVGIDLSGRMLSKARAKGIYSNLVKGDFTDPAILDRALEDRPVDLMIAADVFNYLGDLSGPLQALAQRLRPGGWLCFSVERGAEAAFDLGPGQRFRHDAQVLRAWLAAAGLEILCERETSIRCEKRIPVPGLLVLARRIDQIFVGEAALPAGPADPALGARQT